MNERIVAAEGFECPNCNTAFTEDDLTELCNEPFNGIMLECKNCHKEFEADLLIKISEA